MSAFRDWSIKRKLTTIIMGTTGIALLSASLALYIHHRFTMRTATVQHLEMFAGMIEANIASSLQSNNPDAAGMTLQVLEKEPHIELACLFDRSGKAFAVHLQKGISPGLIPASPLPEGAHWEANHLALSHAVSLDGKQLGTLYLRMRPEIMGKSLSQFAAILAIVFVVSCSIALVLAWRLQRLISDPILRLAATARSISSEKKYALRASEDPGKEVGILIDCFNEMLQQIENREEQLRQYGSQLEREVASRSA